MKFGGVWRKWFLCVGFASCFFAEITRCKKCLGLLGVLRIVYFLSTSYLISFGCTPFISLTAVARISGIIFIKVVRMDMYLLPGFKGGAFSFSLFNVILAIVFLCWNMILLFRTSFFKTSVIQKCWIVSEVTSNIDWNDHVSFVLISLLICVYWTIFHFNVKPSWWHIIFLLCSCIEFASIFGGFLHVALSWRKLVCSSLFPSSLSSFFLAGEWVWKYSHFYFYRIFWGTLVFVFFKFLVECSSEALVFFVGQLLLLPSFYQW